MLSSGNLKFSLIFQGYVFSLTEILISLNLEYKVNVQRQYSLQPELPDHDLKLDEDCLLLSVYSPMTYEGKNSLLPVLIWIHGGGFASGCGLYPMHGPNRIMQVHLIIQNIWCFILNIF